MSSELQALMERFRHVAGMEEATGSVMALQAALKQYFMKNRTWDFHWSERLKMRPPKRSDPDDMTDYDEPVEVKVKDISVEEMDGSPVIKFTFTADEKLSDLEASNDFMAATQRIAKNLYPDAQVSTDDSGKNYLNVVL
jgi:hypothetical protein